MVPVRFEVFTVDVMNDKVNGHFENLVIIAHVSLDIHWIVIRGNNS